MSFDPETVTSYELGYRAALFDRRLNLSLNLFHADYRDVQVPGSVGTVLNGQQTFIGITTNAGRARFQGVEFEGNAIVARDFGTQGDSLNFVLVARLSRRQISRVHRRARHRRRRASARIQNTPRWTASGTLNYGTPVAGGMLNLITTLSYRSASQQFETPQRRCSTSRASSCGTRTWSGARTTTAGRSASTAATSPTSATSSRATTSCRRIRTPAIPAATPVTGNYIPTLGNEGVLTAFYGNPRQVFLTVGLNFR